MSKEKNISFLYVTDIYANHPEKGCWLSIYATTEDKELADLVAKEINLGNLARGTILNMKEIIENEQKSNS